MTAPAHLFRPDATPITGVRSVTARPGRWSPAELPQKWCYVFEEEEEANGIGRGVWEVVRRPKHSVLELSHFSGQFQTGPGVTAPARPRPRGRPQPPDGPTRDSAGPPNRPRTAERSSGRIHRGGAAVDPVGRAFRGREGIPTRPARAGRRPRSARGAGRLPLRAPVAARRPGAEEARAGLY